MENDWGAKCISIQSWLNENKGRKDLSDNGTIDFILSQINRGNKFSNVQIKCWQHICNEIKDINNLDINQILSKNKSKNQNENTERFPCSSPNRGKFRPGETLLLLDSNSDDSQNESKNRESQSGKTGISSMTMLERQKYWLKKKEDKAKAEKQRQILESEKELTFSPKNHSGEYYAQMKSRVRSKSMSGTEKINPTPPVTTSTDRKKSDIRLIPRRASIDESKKKKINRKSEKTNNSTGLLDTIRSELRILSAPIRTNEKNNQNGKGAEVMKINQKEKENNNANKTEINNLQDTNNPITAMKQNICSSESSAIEEPINSEKDRTKNEISNQEEIINFKFDNQNSTDSKGRFKIRDSSLYELKSIYRKRDKFSKIPGISLQMGTHETTHEEEVLSIFFDKSKINEIEAGKWWIENKNRFI